MTSEPDHAARPLALIGAMIAVALVPASFATQHALEHSVTRYLSTLLAAPAHIHSLGLSPLGLSIDSLDAGVVTVRHARVSASPWTWELTGVALDDAHVGAPDLPLAITLDAEHIVAERQAGAWHVRVHSSSVTGPVTINVGDAAVDFVDHRLRRAAFENLSIRHPWLGELADLTGQFSRHNDQLSARVGRPHVEAILEVTLSSAPGSGEIDNAKLSVRFDKEPLGGAGHVGALLGLPDGKTLANASNATLDGTIEMTWEAGSGEILMTLAIGANHVIVNQPLLSARPVGPMQIALDGEMVIAPRTRRLATNRLRLVWQGIPIELNGEIADGESAGNRAGNRAGDLDRPTRFDVRLPRLRCQRLLDALPAGFATRLIGLPLDGELTAHFSVAGALPTLSADDVGLDVDFGCHTIAEAPLGDVSRLGALGTPPQLETARAHLVPAKFAPLRVMPAGLLRALIEAEDTHFFAHHGFDVPMLRRALAHDLQKRRLERGASTLSQQLVKNLYLSTERTLERKLEEAFLTWRLESTTGKERILELYLNLVDFGSGPTTHGIAAAAHFYFNVATSELTIDQAAQLVTLLPAPSRGLDERWRERYEQLRTRLRLPENPRAGGPPVSPGPPK